MTEQDGTEGTPSHRIFPPGTDHLLDDVIAVPPDKDAKALVAAILNVTRSATPNINRTVLAVRMSIVREKAMCLKTLLAKRDAAAGDMLAALERIATQDKCYCGYHHDAEDYECPHEIAKKVAAAARSGAPRPDVLGALGRTVNEQAEDMGLWFITDDAATAYVQKGLRRLHSEIEAAQARGGA